MDVQKVLFVSQEISPYLPDTETSKRCFDLPQGIQELGAQVRTFMPKYGMINERRNQLHEVIRLSGMNIIIDDTDHPLIIKVATLPARSQVYFIYNDDFFAHTLTTELETISSPSNNDERSIFFARGVIETVLKLRWDPSIIHCNGWITALAPVYMRELHNEDPSFRDAKIVYGLWNDDFEQPLDPRLAEKLKQDGFSDEAVADIMDKPVDPIALTKLAISHSDAIIQCCENIKPEVLEMVKASGLPFLPWNGDDNFVANCMEFYKTL
ncbi:MAG: glycogen/starch synthase [Bacteroidales bacterium]|nr:glycogen/starch synthase [Candidatus Sodaliphilus aphodohippi]